MKTTQHTPGPWKAQVISGPYHQQIMTHPDCRQIALARHWPDMDGSNTDIAIAETEANARLIAAAPEMLAALTAWLACHDAAGNTPLDEAFAEPVRSILKNARLAVAKAWGVE